jgi:ABC-type amino acid transport substrate-binding protein
VYPPISWSDGKQVRGLAPSVVKKLFGELGYDVETVVLGNWKRCLLDAAEGRVDVVLAYSTAQREQSMLFSSVPVLREEVALFINRQHPVHSNAWKTWPITVAACCSVKVTAWNSIAWSRKTTTSNGCPTAARTSAS